MTIPPHLSNSRIDRNNALTQIVRISADATHREKVLEFTVAVLPRLMPVIPSPLVRTEVQMPMKSIKVDQVVSKPPKNRELRAALASFDQDQTA